MRGRRTGPEWADTVPSEPPPAPTGKRKARSAAERAGQAWSPAQALTTCLNAVAQSRETLRHLHIVEQTLTLYPETGLALVSQSVLEKAARQLRLLMSHSRFRDVGTRRPDVRGLIALRDLLRRRLMDLDIAARLAEQAGAGSKDCVEGQWWSATMPLDLELPLTTHAREAASRVRAWPLADSTGGDHA